MELEFFTASFINLAINLGYSIAAIIISVYALLWVDKKLLTEIDIEQEIKNGNIAASIFASAILVFVAIVIAFGFKG
ncbi:DUF350 domain-containing protein [Parendozoicomonas haliclonae]|uniref:DUF350 domain-containing protein n=1 Tax=Parendozoicomonas haliclonae TaxID=1960125 RepID=A0A1X7AGF2_9GAMM|nr:DUF350 domain-containing protein [Parendozoicomonas haliclonae]SMA38665.1 hypothetical protein EHSB41UT_00910 [Parendozoicomonas haliclonae]